MRIKLWAGLMGKYPAYVLVPCPSAYWVDCPSYPGTLVLLGYFRYAVERDGNPIIYSTWRYATTIAGRVSDQYDHSMQLDFQRDIHILG